jgi:RHS repeat-associated protein
MRYDEAGRVVGLTDGAGTDFTFRYDTADRLLSRSASGSADPVRYTFEGRLLAGVADAAQLTRYRRDALGRIIDTTVGLAGLPGPGLHLSRDYDLETGLQRSQGLAGGQSLLIRPAAISDGGVPRQVRLRSSFWTKAERLLQQWLPADIARRLSDLMPSTAIARNIEVSPFDGLIAFDFGNGSRMQRTVDAAGRTVRLFNGRRKAPVGRWRYTYDVGPRIRTIERLTATAKADEAEAHTQSFAYDSAGALTSSVAGRGPDPGAVPTRSARLRSDPSPAMVRDKAGRVVQDERFRYSYSAFGQLEAVDELPGNRRIAEYAYNHRGQRTKKTVYAHLGQAASVVHYLWSDTQLVAEVAPDGSITTQYLSLDDGGRSLPVARLQHDRGRAPGSKRDMLLAIHADHRGAPVAMSDAHQRTVWQAEVEPFGVAILPDPRPARREMNLRLPGQYFDAETGLHDNWHRTYDPQRGSYLQPDPLGYPDGPDAYAYAGGDPINRIDPLGLYEVDVHYYMTFFLGVTAGLDPQEARIVALAAQYVDDNRLTRPVNPAHIGTTVASLLHNHQQLLSYHFVLSDADGRTLPAYRNNRLVNEDSPQLRNLLDAAHVAGIGRDASLQFLGEYLHALADTYSHRDVGNRPYDAFLLNCGVGHGYDLHAPDLTYDEVQSPSGRAVVGRPFGRRLWWREARTLAMERDLHGRLLAFGDPARARSVMEIEAVLREFNAIRESESTGNGFAQKIALLQSSLQALGYPALDLGNETLYGYSERDAMTNRLAFLRDVSTDLPLREEDFPGTCLEGGTRCGQR